MLVDPDARDDPVVVEFRVELGGVEVGLHAEHLDGAAGRRREQSGRRRQHGARLLVPHERVEGLGQAGEQGVAGAVVGHRDRDGAHRLAVRPVDEPALVHAQGADAVAGAQEGEVALDDLVQHRLQLRLHAALDRGLRVLGVARVERAAADDHAGVRVEVERRNRRRLHANAVQLRRFEPGRSQESLVLVLGGLVLGAGLQEQEGLHDRRS